MSENKIVVVSQFFGFFGENSGTIQILPYNEFLNKPFIKMVACRQFENPPVDIVPQTLEFVNEIRHNLKNPGDARKSWFKDITKLPEEKHLKFDFQQL